MARTTHANLELRKARKSTAALELNQAMVVRLLGVLQAVASSPRLDAQVVVIHPAALVSTPSPQMQAAAVLGQEGELAAISPAPLATIQARVVIEASMASTLNPVVPGMAAEYDINVFRGPSHQTADDWQQAGQLTDAVAEEWEVAANQPVTLAAGWQEAAPDHSQAGWTIDQAPRCYQLGGSGWQEGQALGTRHGQSMTSLPPGHAEVVGLWVEGDRASQWHLSGYTHPPRGDVGWDAIWQEAAKLGLQLKGDWQLGLLLHLGWRDGWDEAMWPLPGISPPPKPPITPERPDKRRLRLAFGRPRGDASLEFVWYSPDTVVIPTRRVYFVTNSVSIVRASDGLDIPCSGVSCEFDYDSWAWTFSATILSVAAAQSVYGQEVIITINGHQWRMKVDTWRDNRSWGQQSATLGGRGLTAELSSSVMLETSYSEPAARTMVQLATERLPPGWTLDWRAADWLVPGGVYGFEKSSPISALQALAEAAAAFLLPDPMNRHIIVLPKYPTAPWAFAGAIADIVIPEQAMITLGEDHMDGQNVNGVYVVGKDVGVVGRVYRQGSGADRLLPDITHELCVDVLAARVLGIEALAKAGPRTNQEIEMGISGDTGLILPGKLIQTSKGRGYSRSIKASAKVDEKQRLVVRQVISIERGGT